MNNVLVCNRTSQHIDGYHDAGSRLWNMDRRHIGHCMLVRAIPPTGTYGDAGRNLPTSTNYFGVGSLHTYHTDQNIDLHISTHCFALFCPPNFRSCRTVDASSLSLQGQRDQNEAASEPGARGRFGPFLSQDLPKSVTGRISFLD